MPFRTPDEPELDALTRALALQVSAERVRRGLTQVELARLCGTTQSAVARLERGTRPPRLDTLLRIANALDCELDVRLRPRTRMERKPGATKTTCRTSTSPAGRSCSRRCWPPSCSSAVSGSTSSRSTAR